MKFREEIFQTWKQAERESYIIKKPASHNIKYKEKYLFELCGKPVENNPEKKKDISPLSLEKTEKVEILLCLWSYEREFHSFIMFMNGIIEGCGGLSFCIWIFGF